MSERVFNNNTSTTYYKRLVELRMKCNQLSTKMESELDVGVQERFQKYMSLYAKEIVPKYQEAERDRPEELEEVNGLEVSKLPPNKCKSLLRDFNRLMDELGIVSKAQKQFEEQRLGGNR